MLSSTPLIKKSFSSYNERIYPLTCVSFSKNKTLFPTYKVLPLKGRQRDQAGKMVDHSPISSPALSVRWIYSR